MVEEGFAKGTHFEPVLVRRMRAEESRHRGLLDLTHALPDPGGGSAESNAPCKFACEDAHLGASEGS
jgi:hypothetical protein